MKVMGVYEVAALLISVFWFVGCGGSMQGPSSSSNPPNMSSNPPANRASSKFLYVVNSIEETFQGFAIDAATGALTEVGAAAATDDAPIYAAATPDGKFLYVANVGTKATGVSAYRIDGIRGSLMPSAPGGVRDDGRRATVRDGGELGLDACVRGEGRSSGHRRLPAIEC